MKQKHFYYIAVDTVKGVRLVTGVDNASKYARWARDGKPLALSKSVAQDITWSLCMNLTPAYVVESLFEIEYQWVTPEPTEGDAE